MRLFRDPFYRYEARRYWRESRYVWTGLFMFFWAAGGTALLLANFRARSWWGPTGSLMEWLGGVVLVHISWRAVLGLFALVAGATAIAPERASGHLEQFVLTPIEPRHYALARYAARLKGFFVIWLVLSLALGGLFIYGVCLCSVERKASYHGYITWEPLSVGTISLSGLFLLLLHLDMFLWVMMNAALGFRFSSTSRATVWALVKAVPIAFVVVPLVTGIGALAGSVQGLDAESPAMVLVAGVITNTILALLIMYLCLKQAERAIEKAFFRPEEV
jgi:hypothetical protein